MNQLDSLCLLKELRQNAENLLSGLEYQIRQIENDLIRTACPKVGKHTLEFSYAHGCPTSPTGYCAFDVNVDPSCDECLFCDLPEDRG